MNENLPKWKTPEFWGRTISLVLCIFLVALLGFCLSGCKSYYTYTVSRTYTQTNKQPKSISIQTPVANYYAPANFYLQNTWKN